MIGAISAVLMVAAGLAAPPVVFQSQQPGWPRSAGPGFHASPAIADVDGDGLADLLAADINGLVYVWKHDGTYLPGWPRSAGGGAIFSAPAVGDVDGDGDAEVVVTTYDPPRVVAFHHDGAFVSGFPFDAAFLAGDQIRAAPALGYFDLDPALEIAAVTVLGNVFILDAPAAVLPGWPQRVPLGARATPAIVDLDHVGRPELLIRLLDVIYVFDSVGNVLPGWPRSLVGSHSSPAVADLDGDGVAEIVVPENSGVFVMDPEGDPLLRRVLPSFAHFTEGGVAIADLTADQGLEIVVPGEGGVLHLLDRLLNERPGWPVQLGAEVGWTPIIADLDGDGQQEIIAGTDDGEVHVLGADGAPRGLPLTPLSSAIRGALAAGDLDGDGGPELAALDLNGEIFVFDFPGPWDPFFAEWPQAQASERRDGAHWSVADLPDGDGDDDPDASDCAPVDPSIHHRAVETCNGLDDNCNDVVDELDADEDGFGACVDDCDDSSAVTWPGAPILCDGINNDCDDPGWPAPPPGEADADGDGSRLCSGDCDDTVETIRPEGVQLCGDGLNNDCSHPAWPSLAGTNESDEDGDARTECAGDCDDANPAVYGGAPQICGDGLNNDCLNPDWPADPTDTDDDLDGLSECTGDCDDHDAAVLPGRPEICDGKDNDCDGMKPADENDEDNDSWLVCEGDCDDARASVRPGGPQLCGDNLNNNCGHPSWPALTMTNEFDDDGDSFKECGENGDCDDSRASVYPGALQVCGDGLNNDCSDPGWPVVPDEVDQDQDGFAPCGPAPDCDDQIALVYPGAAQICGDGVNNDCLDPAWPSIPANELDTDGDSFTPCFGDCDDASAVVYPFAPQICGDGLNNNCHHNNYPLLAGTNEGDDDGDALTECGGDCDDTRGTVYPGAPQICDGLNNDCSAPGWPSILGTTDADDDGDGWSPCAGDCDPLHAGVYPGAAQVCGDGLNNDCLNPQWPADMTETDDDGDGQSECSAAADCNDADSSVFAFAPQVCGDGKNNDCRHPSWPLLTGTNESDDDGDSFAECSVTGDCSDANAAAWATPGEARAVTATFSLATQDTTLSWLAPSQPGGATLLFDVVRATSPWDFTGDAICLESAQADQVAVDATQTVPVTRIFYYLVRARNGCPGAAGVGVLGTDSSGAVIVGKSCP